jgi:DnaJ-domain-containing protein 1
VSIGKRLIDLARSELNSLLDRAAQLDDDDKPPSGGDGDEMGEPPREAASRPRPRARSGPSGKVRLEDLSDAELEAEIERRRLDRELDERARRNANARTASGAYRAATGAYGSTGTTGTHEAPRTGTGGRGGPRPWTVPGDPVAKAYAALEVPPGSNFETVRKAYRNLMRKYHPDRHTASPEKQKAANELAQKLTASYEILEKHLRR